MQRVDVRAVVLSALESANQTRVAGERLDVSPTAAIFGPSSPLDSLGLVALLIDIEEAFDRAGVPIVLSDERAVSQTRSPFRDVPALVDYIVAVLGDA